MSSLIPPRNRSRKNASVLPHPVQQLAFRIYLINCAQLSQGGFVHANRADSFDVAQKVI